MDTNDKTNDRSESRDFFAEGVDAFLSGHSDIPPADVSEHGLDAEADWIDGYMSAEDGKDDDLTDDAILNSL